MSRASIGFLILVLGFISFASGVSAQGLPGGADPLVVQISPQYPSPYQTIRITPSSTLIDLRSSKVRITVNGVVVAEGSGSVSGQAAVGGPGERTTIVVSATTNGQTQQKTLVVRPADVALILEAQSTSHPFYEGGQLVAPAGNLRVIALPDLRTSAGTAISRESLVYTWKLGDQILEAQSGIGKNVLTAVAPVRYRDANISLTVASQDSSVVAQKSLLIDPVDPLVRIYRNDPLLGPLFSRALSGNFTLSGSEEGFRAVPYHFASIPGFSWLMNNSTVGIDDTITVRATGNGLGAALVSVTARGQGLESASTALPITFGENRPLGIFGL